MGLDSPDSNGLFNAQGLRGYMGSYKNLCPDSGFSRQPVHHKSDKTK